MPKSLFVTRDFYLAAAVALECNIAPTVIYSEKDVQVDFTFPETEQVRAATRAYALNQLDVKVLVYASMVKRLHNDLCACRRAAKSKEVRDE